MLRAILWKEWRQQGLFFLAILLLAGLAIGTTALTLPQEWANLAGEPILRLTLFFLVQTFIVSQAVACAALLFAGEREEGTLTFVDVHSGRRLPVWASKMIAGLTIVFASAAVLGGVLVGFGITSTIGLPLSLWIAVDVLAWAAVASAYCETTFKGIGLALLMLVFAVAQPLSLLQNGYVEAYFLIKLPLFAFALGVSWWIFCHEDALRRGRPQVIRTARVTGPNWLTVSLWMLVRRQGMGLAIVSALAIAAPIVAVIYGPLVDYRFGWPLLSYFIGCVSGWSVFSTEQEGGTESYLGDRRFPRGRLWLGKVGVWLAIAAGACLILGILEHFFASLFRPGISWLHFREFSYCLLGFGFAQFFGMWTRKSPVTIFLTLLVATPLSFSWYAPLNLCIPEWRAWLIPMLLIVATRWDFARWTSGRLHDRRGLVWTTSVALFCGLWTAGNLYWRVWEVPDVGEPFDVAALRRELAEPDRGKNGAALSHASEEAFSRLGEARRRLRLPGSLGAAWKDPAIDFPSNFSDAEDVIDLISILGYPDEPGQVKAFVDDLFAGDWVGPFRKAALAAPDRLPRVTPVDGRRGPTDRVAVGGSLFVLRAAERFSDGKRDEALEDLGVALATVRHLLSSTFGWIYTDGQRTQRQALCLAETLLRRAGHDAAFQRQLGELLASHESRLPSFAEVVKLTYLKRDILDAPDLSLPPLERIHEFLTDTRWEAAREDRVLRAIIAGMVQRAEVNDLPPRKAGALANLPPGGFGRSAEEWADIYQHTQDRRGMALATLMMQRDRYAQDLLRLRGLRLSIAAARYRAETGRDLVSLDDLVPRYFDMLPRSPYGASFRYRVVAEGENWERSDSQVRDQPIMLPLTAGQGLVETPDAPSLVFLVPRP
jgi:hypothetical protein